LKLCSHLRHTQCVLHKSHGRCWGDNPPHSKLCGECHKLLFTDLALAEIAVEAGQTFHHLCSCPKGSCMELSLVILGAIFVMWCHLLQLHWSIFRNCVCSGSSMWAWVGDKITRIIFQLALKPQAKHVLGRFYLWWCFSQNRSAVNLLLWNGRDHIYFLRISFMLESGDMRIVLPKHSYYAGSFTVEGCLIINNEPCWQVVIFCSS